MEEIEVKFLDIDPEAIQKKLEALGAERVGEFFYKRRVFDHPDLRLDKSGAWVRVRDEGEKITVSFKQRLGRAEKIGDNDSGMEEIEIEVSDFDKMAKIFEKVGLKEKFYEENKRLRYLHQGTEFDIDWWPELKPYLEIEAPTWEKIDEAIKMLGLNPADKKIFSTHQIYKLNGIEEKDYQRITFDGLEKKV